jgi:hypothetical protein
MPASSLFLLDITKKNSLQLGLKDDISSPRFAQSERFYESSADGIGHAHHAPVYYEAVAISD